MVLGWEMCLKGRFRRRCDVGGRGALKCLLVAGAGGFGGKWRRLKWEKKRARFVRGKRAWLACWCKQNASDPEGGCTGKKQEAGPRSKVLIPWNGLHLTTIEVYWLLLSTGGEPEVPLN